MGRQYSIHRTRRQRKPVRSASKVVHELMPIIEDTKMSFANIAERAGCHKNSIQRMRTGESTPGIIMLEALAEVCGAEIVVRRKEYDPRST